MAETETLPNPSCPFTDRGECHGECPDNQHRICIDGEAYPK